MCVCILWMLKKRKERNHACVLAARGGHAVVVILGIRGFGQHVHQQRLGRSGTGSMQLLLFWILEGLDNMY